MQLATQAAEVQNSVADVERSVALARRALEIDRNVREQMAAEGLPLWFHFDKPNLQTRVDRHALVTRALAQFSHR